ncbi:MAG: hypothetical protein RLN81_06730 [Balneolaceae bacterium]
MDHFNHRKTRDIGDILTDTFQYVRIHYITLGKGLLFFVLPLYLVQVFLMQDNFSDLFNLLAEPDNPEMFGNFFNGKYFLGIALSIVAYTMLSLVILNHIKFTEQEIEFEPIELIEDFFQTGLRLLGLYVLIYLIVLISVFFFVLPAIFFAIKLCLAQTASVIEERSITSSLSRSWYLTKEYWWATFALILVMLIIVWFSSFVLMFPITILSGFFVETGLSNGSDSVLTLFNIISIISSVFGTLLISLIYISITLQFYNLVERKEGGDLRSKIESLID